MPPRAPRLFVTPLLEAELTASPTLEAVEAWRRRVEVKADPSTVLGTLLSRFDGLTVAHEGVRATVRGFGCATSAGERGVFVLMEVETRTCRQLVVALDRGYDRVLGAPASPEAAARMEAKLRVTLEGCVADGEPLEAQFFGIVSEFLEGLPGLLVAPALGASIGGWVLEHVGRELTAIAPERPLSRGQRLSVHFRVGDGALRPTKDGTCFAPWVALRRTNAKGKVLGETDQQVSIGAIGADTWFEPLPDVAVRSAALDVVRRWAAELARRLAEIAPSDVRSMMPMELPWPTSPIALAVQVLRHGPPGPRACAGSLGPLAHATAKLVRELDRAETAALNLAGVVRAHGVGAHVWAFRQREDDDDRVEESLWLRRVDGAWMPVVCWLEDERRAHSADADEPAWRLFAEWLGGALVAGGLDRPLPRGVAPSEWLRLQDRDGEPLDPRVVEGMLSVHGYEEVDDLPSAADLVGCAIPAAAAFRALVRDLVDPDARFGQKVAQLGLP